VTGSPGDGARCVPLSDALDRGPDWWDGLVASSPTASPFMGWAWHQAWAESATPEELRRSFAIILSGPDGGDQGLLPLSIRSVMFRRATVPALTWATRGVGCPDHLDIPAAAGLPLETVLPLLEAMPWNVIALGGVAEDAPNVARFADELTHRGCTVRRTVLDGCPYIDLPASWDAYLAGLSKSRRQTIRWTARKLAREHAVVVTDYGTPERVAEGWEHLCTLHDTRWRSSGALSDPRLARLLRRFSGALAARGELWLTTLDLDGEPAAAWYGFTSADTVYFYQSGRNPRWESESVGLVLLGAMIQRAIERGYRRFDFLRGRDAYKRAWTTTERAIYELIAFRPGWRGAWLRGLDLAGRARARLRSRSDFAVADA
jgi:CelD/BcsL family acetyltransferase involved in cellulose biosynthesis